MDSNKVLKKITYEINRKRPIIPRKYRTNYRLEKVNGGLLCDVWFLTTGCIHDASGGCVMCNYGKGSVKVEQECVLEELGHLIKGLPWEFEDFLLTPSGSMLDEREVSENMREHLVPILQGIRAKRFIVETRSETVTEEGLAFLKKMMPRAETYVEIGLESSNNWVLKHCINKGNTFEDFEEAVRKAHRNHVLVTANVGLGFPFMSERASVSYTIQTIEDALRVGADCIALFPYHIKKDTLLEVMMENRMYKCVSLWSLARVLEHFSDIRDRIQISWYKDYFGRQQSFILHSPETCDNCKSEVIRLLDQYRNKQDLESIYELNQYQCTCRKRWEECFNTQSLDIDLDMIEQYYRELSKQYSIDKVLLESELKTMKKEYEEQV